MLDGSWWPSSSLHYVQYFHLFFFFFYLFHDLCYAPGKDDRFHVLSAITSVFRLSFEVAKHHHHHSCNSFHCCHVVGRRFKSHSRLSVYDAVAISSKCYEQTIQDVCTIQFYCCHIVNGEGVGPFEHTTLQWLIAFHFNNIF